MTNLFDRISTFIAGCNHGWCGEAKAHSLGAAVLALRPEVSVEIGVWAGKSLIPIALALKEVGRGKVLAIDPWNPLASADGQSNQNLKWWSEADHELVYREFQKNVLENGVSNCVEIIRCRSDDVTPPPQIGILSIDGNHGPQSEKDVERFAPNVITGGLVFADDLEWEGGAVLRAVAKLKSMGFKELYRIETGAVYQKRS